MTKDNFIENKRNKIDKIDRKMGFLFKERMKNAGEIAAYKQEAGLKIHDPEREQKIFEDRCSGYDSLYIDYYMDLLKKILDLSKEYQKEIFDLRKSSTKDIKKLLIRSSQGAYPLYLASSLLDKAAHLFSADAADFFTYRKVMIISQEPIAGAYIKSLKKSFPHAYTEIVETGESAKSFDTLLKLIKRLADLSFDRQDLLIGLGGGVVCDLCGFLASIYMRGISYYNIPTSLLAQVDASIGGKTALDFMGTKNLIGSFYPPAGVIVDPSLLSSLDNEEFACGMAELIKMAACFDKELFLDLEKLSLEELRFSAPGYEKKELQNQILEDLIYRGLLIKKALVEEDEKEKGPRKALNFGHTIGHALESLYKIKHGQAVSIGMLYCTAPHLRARLKKTLNNFGLPTFLKGTDDPDIKAELFKLICQDKKIFGDKLSLILLTDIGQYKIKSIAKNDILNLLEKKGDLLFS